MTGHCASSPAHDERQARLLRSASGIGDSHRCSLSIKRIVRSCRENLFFELDAILGIAGEDPWHVAVEVSPAGAMKVRSKKFSVCRKGTPTVDPFLLPGNRFLSAMVPGALVPIFNLNDCSVPMHHT